MATLKTAAQVEAEVYTFLTVDMGFNVAAACGVLANIEKESSFKYQVIGDNGTSFGLCQWHLGRWDALKENSPADWQEVSGQMRHLRIELEGRYYKKVLDFLRSVPNTAQGAYDAAHYWCMYFEIPHDKENVSIVRGNLAKDKYWPKYTSTPTPGNTEVAPEPANPELSEVLEVGATVYFKGGPHYYSSNATVATNSPAPGLASVTGYSKNGLHKWHLIHKDSKSTVYGWVDEANIQLKEKVNTYVVKMGDNLTKIAKMFNTTVAKLVADNNIENPNLIWIGQVLKV